MTTSPRSVRPHIVLAGKRNCGKSSLINHLTGHDLAIVSDTPGTTTDPVSRSTELLPFGPVVFVDTAGNDDVGDLGRKRVAKTREVLGGADVILYTLRPSLADEADMAFLADHKSRVMAVITFSDLEGPEAASLSDELASRGIPLFSVSNTDGFGVENLRAALVSRLREIKADETTLLQDLVKPYQMTMLICPIDREAPAGRLILPQVQTIREILDSDGAALVVKEREVDWALRCLAIEPDLAITDSQAVLKASGSVPQSVPLTTFSILFSHWKGRLQEFVDNVVKIDELVDGDRVLIAESCSHRSLCDDIARVKIPRWLRQYTGRSLDIDVVGGPFPEDLSSYSLVIHCGGCMITRHKMLSRMDMGADVGVPMTNYGVAISYLQGVLDRVVEPFGVTVPKPGILSQN